MEVEYTLLVRYELTTPAKLKPLVDIEIKTLMAMEVETLMDSEFSFPMIFIIMQKCLMLKHRQQNRFFYV